MTLDFLSAPSVTHPAAMLGKRLHVVTVAVNSPPKNTAESLQVAKVLKYLGRRHDVTLITTRELGGWRPRDESLKDSLASVRRQIALAIPEQRYVNGIFRRLSMPRLDDDFLFPTRAIVARLKVGGRPDLVYSRATPHSTSLMALALARKWRVPWVLHMSDPWVGNGLDQHGDSRYLSLERRCLERATVVTVTSPATRALYKGRYPRLAAKFHLFPNVYDDDDVWSEPPPAGFPYVVAHTGRLYGVRGAKPIADALTHLKAYAPQVLDRLRFVFVGFADEQNAKLLRDLSPYVDYRGPTSKAGALEVQRAAHALLLLDPPTAGETSLFLPSKLLDYFAARRPILAVTSEGSTSREVLGNRACFAHDDGAGLARHLANLVEAHASTPLRADELPPPPPEYAAAFNVERLAELFVRL